MRRQLNNHAENPEITDPHPDAGVDAPESEPDGAVSEAVDTETVPIESDPDRLRAVGVISSAIRSAGVGPGSLPVRPELRRLEGAINVWLLLSPLAALAVNVLIKILPRYVPFEKLDRGVVTALTPATDTTYHWVPFWYFVPIIALGCFVVLMVSAGVYRFMSAKVAPNWLATKLPIGFLVFAFFDSVYILMQGAKIEPYVYAALLGTLAYIMAFALPVNWMVSSVLVRSVLTGRRAKVENLFFCAGLCSVVVGAGFCWLLGTDVVDAVGGTTPAPVQESVAGSAAGGGG